MIASVLLKARAVEQCGSEPSRLQAHKQEEALTQVAMDGKTLPRNVRPIEMGTRGFLRESLTITGEEHLLLPDKLLVVVVPTLITLIFSPTSTAVVLGLTLLLGGGVRCMQASNSCERQPEEEPLLPGGNTLSSSWLCSKDGVEVYFSPSANLFGIRLTRWSSAASVWSVSCLLLALVCIESA